MEEFPKQHGTLHPKTQPRTHASQQRLQSNTSAQPVYFAHNCTDTLCRLRCEIFNHGPVETWKKLSDFVMVISNSDQNSESLPKYERFMIHEIFRTHGDTNPVDFIVIIGQASLRLGPFASTAIGSAALRDLFSSPNFPQLTKQTIEQSLELWKNRADRKTCQQEDPEFMYEVSSSPLGRRIWWNKKIQCDYKFDDLAQTEAGRVLLAIPMRNRTDTGGEVTEVSVARDGRSAFEFEDSDEDSCERPKDH